VKIFRLEDKLGKGAYRSVIGQDLDCLSTSLGNHPLPEKDKKLIKNAAALNIKPADCAFAFSSLNQLKKWFSPKTLNQLDRAGFILATYETPTVVKGNTQIMFPKEFHAPEYIVNLQKLSDLK